jgi:hypothetical protein
MTVAGSLTELDRAWVASHAAADALRLTLQEDVPRTGEQPPKPVEQAAEIAAEIADLLRAGCDRLARDRIDDEVPGDAVAAVAFAQDRWLEASRLVAKLNEPRRLFELDDFVQRRGDQWEEWWPLVLSGLEALIPSLWEAEAALTHCWRELTERGRVEIGSATVGSLQVRVPIETTTGDV